jgi:pimeloyl-ACP methyl ester carboxylesterase
MSTFLLVHGAWHGGWCWSGVIDELAQRGHRSVAPDLPCDVPAAGWADYANVAVAALDGIDDDIVAVGHSLGGGVIPLVAASRPVARLVFVGSFPPEPGRSLDDSLSGEPNLTDPQALVFRDAPDDLGRYVWPSFDVARYAMYHDCPVDRARWAFSRLRAQSPKPFSERWPLDDWPDLPMTFIVCSEDRMGRAGPLREVAHRRFGLEAKELEGGHSPFLSRPAELAGALLA